MPWLQGKIIFSATIEQMKQALWYVLAPVFTSHVSFFTLQILALVIHIQATSKSNCFHQTLSIALETQQVI